MEKRNILMRLTALLLVAVMTMTATGANTHADGLTGADVTPYIVFSDGQLSNTSSTIAQGDGNTFNYGTYTFSINWSVDFAGLADSLYAGDYFTFQAPAELYKNLSLEVKNTAGTVMADLTVDADGNGKVVFNEQVEDLGNIVGTISLGGQYEENSKNATVNWKFVFSDTYEYRGVSSGREYSPETIQYDNNKQGWQSSNTKYMIWTARINVQQDAWSGAVTISDSLGSDHKMATVLSMDTKLFGYYGTSNFENANAYGSARDNYYVGIAVIDWEQMRADYNELLDWNRAQHNTKICYYRDAGGVLDSTGTLVESSYSLPSTNLDYGVSNFMYYFMIEVVDSANNYRYVSPYTGGLLQVSVTDDSYELHFPDGALDKNSYYIRYYSELTSPISPDKVGNTVTVAGENYDDSVTVNESVNNKATIHGTKGKILLYKYDEHGTTPLADVKFTLSRNGSTFSTTATTTAEGMIEFTLAPNNGGFSGIYTLSEDAAPNGYVKMDDMTLTLNSDGEITHVNGVAVAAGETVTNAAGERLCQINSDRLALIMYNKEYLATGTIEFAGTKEITGRDFATGDSFTFELYLDENDGSGYGSTPIAVQTITPTSGNSAAFIFDTLNYSLADADKRYTYKIVEKAESIAGISYDEAFYEGTYEITDSGSGVMAVTLKDGTALESTAVKFTNSYKANGKIVLNAQKQWADTVGLALTAGQFEFDVTEYGLAVATGSNDGDGAVVFSEIEYDLNDLGEHSYQITERSEPNTGIIYSDTAYEVKVQVSDHGDGTLTAELTSVNGQAPGTQELVFTNDTTKVAILKVDENGTPLPGAELELCDENGNPVASWISTETARIFEGTLCQGAVYTLKELSSPTGYILAPEQSFTVGSDGEVQQISMTNMPYNESYSVTVTKYVKQDNQYCSVTFSFYAALFLDQQCTQRASEILELKLTDSYVSTGEFTGLTAGTYYLAETDADGTVLDLSAADAIFTNEITTDVITLTPAQTSIATEITNHLFSALSNPPEQNLNQDDGVIVIDKRVSNAGKAKKVTDTFYFTLFGDKNLTHVITTKSLSLKSASSGKVSFKSLAYGSYYIAETDEKGTPVDNTFGYAVTVSDEKVTVKDSNPVNVQVINDPGGETSGQSTKPGSTDSTSANKAAKATANTTASPKTGDNAPLILYLLLLLGAVVIIVIIVIIYKRKK